MHKGASVPARLAKDALAGPASCGTLVTFAASDEEAGR
jgi:hypothetical protein